MIGHGGLLRLFPFTKPVTVTKIYIQVICKQMFIPVGNDIIL